MNKCIILLTVIMLPSPFVASPMTPLDPNLHRYISEKLAYASGAVNHLTDLAGVLLLGNELVNGKEHDWRMIRAVEHKTRQIQKAIKQALQLNNQIGDPKANKVHVTLLLIRKIEELLLLVKEAYAMRA